MEELPDEIALFPLPNVVLFPGVDLPLHVFEPRYRQMVADAMAGDRLIGMVLLRGDWRRDYHGRPPIFPIGCVGRIGEIEVLPDGRSNLVLRGESCFEVRDEIDGSAYRRARVAWRDEVVPAAGSPEARAAVRRVREAVTRLLARGAEPLPDDMWERLPGDLQPLVNQLGFALDLGAVEKLSLLEFPGSVERAQRLVEIVEFHLAERGLGAASGRGEGPWH